MTPEQPVEDEVRSPTASELVALGESCGLRLSVSEAGELEPVIARVISSINEVIGVRPDEAGPLPGIARGGVRRPRPEEDPFNAFIHFCDVRGDDEGPLSGYAVGVKDNIDVAGVPTTNASRRYHYVPETDAVVVERILRAGGRIVGKLNLDCFSAGATGESSHFGPALNPNDPARVPGGSSSGSAVALRAGQVDLALGGDQAGSARIPAALCGVVALKPTRGLVPTHGMTHLDHSIDSLCPMARSVEDLGVLLAVIAGEDWRDPQWARGPGGVRVDTDWSKVRVQGMRVGVVEQGLSEKICAPAVRERTELAVAALADAGANVARVDLPVWELGLPVVETLLCHLAGAMIASEGEGYGHLGLINSVRQASFARARREHADAMPAYVKVWMLTEAHLHANELNRTYPLLHNLRLHIARELETVFASFDLLVTPTTPIVAPPLLNDMATPEGLASRVLDALPANTSLANLSGHPALAVPSGADEDGLPTSVQLMGRMRRDDTTLAAGHVVEGALSR